MNKGKLKLKPFCKGRVGEEILPEEKCCRRGRGFHLAALAYPAAPPPCHSPLLAVDAGLHY